MARSSTRRFACSAVALAAMSAGSLLATGCTGAMTFTKTERTEGRVMLQEGDADGAAMIFAEQVDRNPKDFRAHYHLGEAQWGQGRYPEAIQSFRTALEVRNVTPAGKNDDEYRLAIIDALATALAEYDTDGTTLATYEHSEQGMTPDRALLVAKTHARAGRPEEAIAAYRVAVKTDPEDQQIVKDYGLYLESLQQEAAAEAVLRIAYRLNTADEDVAAALLRLGVVPGPAILSRSELSTPYTPLGPLPEWRKQMTLPEREAAEQARLEAMQRAAQQQAVAAEEQPAAPSGLSPLPRLGQQDPGLN